MKDWFTHELHPLCTLFPRMAGAEFDALVADIAANGLQNPIVLFDGMVLDGGNRYRACQVADVEPRFAQFTGDSVVAFVLSANLHRRHMSPGQQAAIVASAQDWAKAQVQGANRHTMQTGNVTGLQTVADRAAQSGASDKTQRMADKVAKASPELARQVAHGEKTLPQAVREVSPPKPQKPATAIVEVQAPANDELREQINDLATMLEEVRADNESMVRVFEADDKVTAALAEAKRYREQLRIVESRVTGLMNEANEAKRLARMWQKRCERAEKVGANLAA